MNDKANKKRAIIFCLIEAVIVAAVVIAFEMTLNRAARVPAILLSHAEHEAVFDHDITGCDGTVYPAGTVFNVQYIDSSGGLTLYNDDWVMVSKGEVNISEAQSNPDLIAFADEIATAENYRQKQEKAYDLQAVGVGLVAGLVAFWIFFAINYPLRNVLKAEVIVLIVHVVISSFVAPFLMTYASKAKAPVIYLYPQEDTEVNVRLSLNGEIETTYPLYDKTIGWNVIASPNGTLTDSSGKEYSFLFWEGDIVIKPDLSKGFCVKGEDTAEFLEQSLKQLGLSDTERDAFIMFWLPELENNKYNVITFQTEAYEKAVSMNITPEPDTIIRVNMLWYPSTTYVDMEPQDLTVLNPSEREGFTVVEWGGEKYERGIFK